MGDLITPGTPPGPAPTAGVYSRTCPTRLVLDRVADKWAALVLALLAREPMRFNRLRREVDGVSQKVLSQTLKRLERDGLLERRAFATVPVTVEYAVTPLGRTLAETVAALARWAEANVGAVLAAQAAYDARTGDGAGDRAGGRAGAGGRAEDWAAAQAARATT